MIGELVLYLAAGVVGGFTGSLAGRTLWPGRPVKITRTVPLLASRPGVTVTDEEGHSWTVVQRRYTSEGPGRPASLTVDLVQQPEEVL